MFLVRSVTYVSGSDKNRTGGGGGIRTPETLSGLTVFKTAGFNRSPTPPFPILAYSARRNPTCNSTSVKVFFLITNRNISLQSFSEWH